MTMLDARGRPRVAITGLGVKTAAGLTVDDFWSRLRSGRSTAAPIQRFDTTGFPVWIGCEATDWDPSPYLGPKESRRMDRVSQLGFGAAMDALAQAGEPAADPARAAVVIGTGVGGLITLEEQVHLYLEKGPMRVSPFFVPMMMANATAGLVSMQLGWSGPNLCIATACAAGTHAIGESVRMIRDGSCDVAIAGGTEAAITQPCIAAFARMGALSTRNDDPEHASRPFDADRDGFVMGEGAGVVVLERLGAALARGATVLAEVVGYGRNGDAYHITAPSPGGAGAAACMQLALDDAGLAPEAIVHVNAHGTSTDLNDAAESEAIVKVFGDAAPPVTSTKGVTGHLIGAAGAVEAVVSVLSATTGIVPPTANFERPGEGITIDVVHGTERVVSPGPVLSNSFGFGGHNATIIVAPYEAA